MPNGRGFFFGRGQWSSAGTYTAQHFPAGVGLDLYRTLKKCIVFNAFLDSSPLNSKSMLLF